MKFPISSFLLFFFFTIPVSLFSNTPDKVEDDKIAINFSIQKLEFFKSAEGELRAKLTVSQEVESQTNLLHLFSRSVFFDDNTKVTKIEKLKGGKTKKITPIKYDYESDGIFHSDLKVCYFEHKFTEKGEKVVFSYEKIFLDLKFLDPMYFNDNHPVKQSKIIIEKPDWLTLDRRELNFDFEKPTYLSDNSNNIETHTYELNDLPAGFKYNRAPRRSKINAHLILIANAYTKNGEEIKLIEKVDDLYSWYASLVKQIGNDNSDLGSIVDELVAGKENDLEKIRAIFYWVQDNVRYIAFENGIMGFQPESCQSVFNNKYGDCKGMANLTKEMLTIAGFDARLTWLGTADIPYDYDIPSLVVDNHMICTVILGEQKIFLDPTEKYAELFNYAFRIQGQEALIENGDGFIIETIPKLEPSHNKEFSSHNLKINKERLEGEGNVSFTGNRKTYIFNYLSANPSSKWEELMQKYIANSDKNIQADLRAIPELTNRDKDFQLDYDLSMEHHIIDLGEELYINLESDYSFQKFDMPKKRNVPYEFSGKYVIEHNSTLEIPEGWKATYLPPAVLKENPKYAFNLSIIEQDNKIIYSKKITLKETMLMVNEFDEWNETIKKLDDFYADQIILQKL